MKKLDVGLAALLVAVLAVILWQIVDPFFHRETYRGEVRTLYENLQPGMTKEQVLREMDSGKYPHLDFHREGHLWLGSAPFEFGAGNWSWRLSFKAITSPASAFVKVMACRTFTTRWRRPPTRSDDGWLNLSLAVSSVAFWPTFPVSTRRPRGGFGSLGSIHAAGLTTFNRAASTVTGAR